MKATLTVSFDTKKAVSRFQSRGALRPSIIYGDTQWHATVSLNQILFTHLENIPDILSRAPLSYSVDLQDSVEALISSEVSILPATPDHLASLWAAQTKDEILLQVMHYCYQRKI